MPTRPSNLTRDTPNMCHRIISGSTAPVEDCTQSIADIVFVVDSSGSIDDDNPENWNLTKQFVSDIVGSVAVAETANRIALVEFSNEGILIFNFTYSFDTATIQAGIQGMRFLDGNTNTSGGLYIVLSELLFERGGNRPDVQDYVIVVTDGIATRDEENTIPYAEEIHDTGATLLVVGITGAIDEDEIRAISSPPQRINETYFLTEDFSLLTPIVEQIVQATCSVECKCC